MVHSTYYIPSQMNSYIFSFSLSLGKEDLTPEILVLGPTQVNPTQIKLHSDRVGLARARYVKLFHLGCVRFGFT